MASKLTRAAISYKKCLVTMTYSNQKRLSPPCIVLNRDVSSISTSKSKSNSNLLESQMITKNIELLTVRGRSKPSTSTQQPRPLAVIFSWMLAKRAHIMKYGDFYVKQGFDVLTVKISPFQMFWPSVGSQVVVENLLQFLAKRDDYQPIVIHAFSVGAYMFGETMVKMEAERSKYGSIANRIVGQVFDSATDYHEISTGFPRAMTNIVVLQKILGGYVKFHMSAFYSVATRHYVKASEQFKDTIVSAPSLFLFSNNDPVGTAAGNQRVIRIWKAKGMKVYSRCWERSPHVSHMYHYQKEYLQELENFMATLGLLSVPLEQTNKSKL